MPSLNCGPARLAVSAAVAAWQARSAAVSAHNPQNTKTQIHMVAKNGLSALLLEDVVMLCSLHKAQTLTWLMLLRVAIKSCSQNLTIGSQF